MFFNKVILIALCSSALAVIVQGRETIAQGGGAGGGSNGRGQSKATSTTSSTSSASSASSASSGNSLVGADYTQSSTVPSNITTTTTTIIPAGSASSSSSSNNNNNVDTTTTTNPETGKNIIESSTSNTMSNVGSTSNIDRDNVYTGGNNNNDNNAASSPGQNNNNDIPQNFGTTGSLADRPYDVLCPICDAVADKSYDEGRMINMGGESWTCGYLQETVQDADQFSPWPDVAGVCRQSQLLAEDAGCCADTMYINMPGEDLNDPCELCNGFEVPYGNKDKLVNTGYVGSHTCGGIDFAMKEGIFSSNICKPVADNIYAECCMFDYSQTQTARSGTALTRGGVLP